jgi:hypothetical protein
MMCPPLRHSESSVVTIADIPELNPSARRADSTAANRSSSAATVGLYPRE